MANFNYLNDVRENVARLSSKEQMLGKGLNIPFNATNSGSRKIMDIVHQSHALVLSRGEVPYVGTGYENGFGDYSSSILTLPECMDSSLKSEIHNGYADVTGNSPLRACPYQVIAKIPKFSEAPNHHYYLILANVYQNELHIIERVAHKYITEIYGYLLNNTVLDSLSTPGTIIEPNVVLRRSTGFDQYGNKTNGANLNVVYMSNDNNMEDSVIISDACSEKMKAPLLRKVKKVINENDIPLNFYGNDNMYKAFPDIGEDIKDGILAAFRREDKENAIYTQSVARLQQIMMSDDKIKLKGKVIDINIYCNNPQNLASNICNSQFNKYFLDKKRMCTDIVKIVSPFVAQGYTLSYELQKFFALCKDELAGKEFIDKRKFSNLTIEFLIMEERNLEVGDKVADRYGGKGVVSKVVPQALMPMLPNGMYADMIKNSHGMYGRENPGQIFELSTNYVSMCILDRIRALKLDADEALNMILRFLHIISPLEETKLREYTSKLKQDDFVYFVGTILEETCINVSSEPISDTMSIDKIGELYEEFPWITQVKLRVPIKGSNGQYRYIETRRPMIMGKQYTLRLKQVAEEKFSATSLSSTNIKNENAKSKDSKNYKEMYSNTPIRFGPMETGDMEHMGSDIVIFNMMMYSLSPIGRRAVEEMYTGDPYNVDIKLNTKAKNRSAEQLNARLKTMGYRMVFKKKKKIVKPAMSIPVLEFTDPPEGREVIRFMGPDYDMEHWYKTQEETENILKNSPITISVLSFYDGDKEES